MSAAFSGARRRVAHLTPLALVLLLVAAVLAAVVHAVTTDPAAPRTVKAAK